MVLATTYYGFLNVSIGVLLYAKGHPVRHDSEQNARKNGIHRHSPI